MQLRYLLHHPCPPRPGLEMAAVYGFYERKIFLDSLKKTWERNRNRKINGYCKPSENMMFVLLVHCAAEIKSIGGLSSQLTQFFWRNPFGWCRNKLLLTEQWNARNPTEGWQKTKLTRTDCVKIERNRNVLLATLVGPNFIYSFGTIFALHSQHPLVIQNQSLSELTVKYTGTGLVTAPKLQMRLLTYFCAD